MYCLNWYCHKEGIFTVFLKRDRSYLRWMLSDKIRFCWRQQCPSTARSLRSRRFSLRDRPSRFCRPRWHTWSAAFWFRNYKKMISSWISAAIFALKISYPTAMNLAVPHRRPSITIDRTDSSIFSSGVSSSQGLMSRMMFDLAITFPFLSSLAAFRALYAAIRSA